jgi:hypothetical protein
MMENNGDKYDYTPVSSSNHFGQALTSVFSVTFFGIGARIHIG